MPRTTDASLVAPSTYTPILPPRGSIEEALLAALDTFGATLLRDAGTFKATLPQADPDARADLDLLATAVTERIPQTLLSLQLAVDGPMRERLAKRLSERHGANAYAANWAVRTWTETLTLWSLPMRERPQPEMARAATPAAPLPPVVAAGPVAKPASIPATTTAAGMAAKPVASPAPVEPRSRAKREAVAAPAMPRATATAARTTRAPWPRAAIGSVAVAVLAIALSIGWIRRPAPLAARAPQTVAVQPLPAPTRAQVAPVVVDPPPSTVPALPVAAPTREPVAEPANSSDACAPGRCGTVLSSRRVDTPAATDEESTQIAFALGLPPRAARSRPAAKYIVLVRIDARDARDAGAAERDATRTFSQTTPFAIGTRVRVAGDRLSLRRDADRRP